MNYRHFNTDTIISIIGDKKPIIKKLVREIIDGSERNSTLLKENYALKNWNSLRGNAHFLKSNFRYLGNQRMVEILKKIELNSPDVNKRHELPSLVNEFNSEYPLVINELNEYLNNL
ncbi:MAG: hypothetical protein SFY32_03005 [Bacteroidota bacterium]|nr:hypothetical protein [Bacteroidota bacterium]